jgi:hypothetical protein
MPEWALPVVTQLPLVAVVAYGFLTGRVRRSGEVDDWQRLYRQEREDRIAAENRLAVATAEIKEVVAGVAELTKEVVRNAPR